MSDRLDRVRESIAGERRHWLVVENRPDDLAALLSERDALVETIKDLMLQLAERDALAAVAEAARTVTVLSADLDRWDERNGYVINSERDYLANNLSTAWDRLRDTLAAYDRTVAKP